MEKLTKKGRSWTEQQRDPLADVQRTNHTDDVVVKSSRRPASLIKMNRDLLDITRVSLCRHEHCAQRPLEGVSESPELESQL